MVPVNETIANEIRESGIVTDNASHTDTIFKATFDSENKAIAKIDFDTCVGKVDLRAIEESVFAINGIWPKDDRVRVKFEEGKNVE